MNDEVQNATSKILQMFPGAEVLSMNKRPCRLCEQPLIFIKGPGGEMMAFDEKPQEAWYLDQVRDQARSFQAHTVHIQTCSGLDEPTRKELTEEGQA